MDKKKAIEFLKYLHNLETQFKNDLFAQEQLKTVEEIRMKFLENYQK